MFFVGILISFVTCFDCQNIQISGYKWDISSLFKEPLKITFDTVQHEQVSTDEYNLYVNLCKELAKEKDIPDIDQCPDGTWVCRKITNKKEGNERVISVVSYGGEPKQVASSNAAELFLQTTSSGATVDFKFYCVHGSKVKVSFKRRKVKL
jgi:hypothetical protein